MIDTHKQFQLQTGVFLKRPDVVTFDDMNRNPIREETLKFPGLLSNRKSIGHYEKQNMKHSQIILLKYL